MAGERTPERSSLRLADLKQRQHVATRMMNVKVPAQIAESITDIAARLGASRTEVVVALLNASLDRLKRTQRR